MIRIQPVGGPWQVLGRDLYPGIEPEDVTPAWGAAGPESLTFALRRPPHRVHADLLPYTPVELHPGADAAGEPLWAGYTMQAPPGGGGEATTVSCVGWHFYRDDRPAPALYVHDDLSSLVDARTVPTEDLAVNHQAASVQVGDGTILLGWHQGTTVANPRRAAVMLDLGPSSRAKRMIVEYQGSPALDTNLVLGAIGADKPHNMGLGVGEWEGPPHAAHAANAAGFQRHTFVTPRRYILIFAEHHHTGTIGFEVWWRIKRVLIAADTAYEAADASALTADQVIRESRDRLTPLLLSKDNSRITTVQFKIPALAFLSSDATARQIQDAVNDYHGYRLGVDAARRQFFLPQPSRPRLQVDAQAAGVSYRDTSTNDGSEVYNHVSVRGRSGSGEELRLDRWLADYVTVDDRPAEQSFVNPSFDVDVTGWTLTTRITSTYDSAPAAGSTQAGAQGSVQGPTFEAGRFYRVTLSVLVGPFLSGPRALQVPLRLGTSSDYVEQVAILANGASAAFFKRASIVWVPRVACTAADVKLTIGRSATIDSVSIATVEGGVLTRRKRTRSFTLTVAAPTDLVAMDSLANAWLLAHRTTPFKGSLAVTGDAVVDLEAGAQVRAGELGRYYGEMIRVLGVPDPDTGDLQSRDGIIASVNGLDPAQLAIDTERRSLEALLARMGASRG